MLLGAGYIKVNQLDLQVIILQDILAEILVVVLPNISRLVHQRV